MELVAPLVDVSLYFERVHGAGGKLCLKSHLHVKLSHIKGNVDEMERDVATSWQLQGLRDNYGVCKALTERLPGPFRNIHIDPVTATRRLYMKV